MTDREFEGQIVLVTGGASGIGAATAIAYAAAGATVVVADISADAGTQVVADIAGAGGRAEFVATDVTSPAAVEALIAGIVARHGRLDCAFNNAGIEEETTRLGDGDETLFDRMMAINVKGVWLCMKHQLAQMARQRQGCIVNTASVAGLVGAPKHAVYAASKHAVLGLTRSAAAEYGRMGIRVNAICPGIIRTPMFERAVSRQLVSEPAAIALHPIGRLGEAHEVANAVLFLSSQAAPFITGHALTIDGGMTAI